MNDRPVEWHRDGFDVSTDRARLPLDAALDLLRSTYWGTSLDRTTLERAVANSVCFGVYQGTTLVGFARIVTDLATYGYVTDVVIAPAYRGRGLGRWLTACMLEHPELRGFRRLALLTRDAHSLYAGFGFTPGSGALTYMERKV